MGFILYCQAILFVISPVIGENMVDKEWILETKLSKKISAKIEKF